MWVAETEAIRTQMNCPFGVLLQYPILLFGYCLDMVTNSKVLNMPDDDCAEHFYNVEFIHP